MSRRCVFALSSNPNLSTQLLSRRALTLRGHTVGEQALGRAIPARGDVLGVRLLGVDTAAAAKVGELWSGGVDGIVRARGLGGLCHPSSQLDKYGGGIP
jgi:hypothetical protein